MSEPGQNLLVKLPVTIVEHLKDEPVLLGGMGAGAIIAIIAVYAPASAQVYGWIVGGLMFLLCLGKLIVDARTDKTRTTAAHAVSQSGGDQAPRPDGSNNIEVGDKSKFRNNRIRGDQNNFKGGNRVTVEGTVFDAGASRSHPPTTDKDASPRQ